MVLTRSALLAVCFFLVAAGTLQAQKYKEGIRFNHITQREGLSQSSGHDILQDSQGFMWFATNDGLNRYNGYEMTVYKEIPSDSTSISGNNISVLFEDSDNNLWVGTTGNGLNLYNRDRGDFTHFKPNDENPGESITDNIITAMLEDKEGKLWIGTPNGLNWYLPQKDEFVHFFASEHSQESADSAGLSSSGITALAKGQNGHIWIGTEEGLNRWNPKTENFSRFRHDPADPHSISSNYVQTLHAGSQGTLWIGTSQGGLNKYNAEEDKFYRYTHNPGAPNTLSGNSILSLHEDSQGTLWVGTDNDGLNAFDQEEERFYQFHAEVADPSSLSNKSVYSIYESPDQILWVGTFSGGINYFELQPPEFEHYKHNPIYQDQLSHNSVLSLLEDSRENFWIGTDGGGLNLFNRQEKTFKAYLHDPEAPNSPSSDVILAMHEDQNRDIWLGYYQGGVSKFDPLTGQYTHYRHREDDSTSLSSNDVYGIHQDRAGDLWFGTNGWGLNRLNRNTGTFTNYLPSQTIRAIQDAGNGALWVGTYGGGLIYFDPQTGEHEGYTQANSDMPGNVVMVIHEGENGVLWLGTRRGITRFNPQKWTFVTYNTSDGLPGNTVNGIVEDREGMLWISTNAGISKFNPDTESFTNYGTMHGLQSDEFNPLSYYRDRKGYIYFGGINGFNRFHPQNVTIDRTVPPVKITDLQILNNSVSVGENSPLQTEISQARQIKLSPYDASVITFEFAALNYKPVKDNNFAYKLEEFDSNWNYVGNKRTATYTNLDPGEYTFRVKTSNSDGVWNEGTQLAMTIKPHFWQTYPFYVIAGTFLAAFLLGFYQWKVLSVRWQNERLEQTVSKRTEELHKRNDELKSALDELKKTRSELVEKAHKAGMADIATGVLHNVGNILNSVNASTSVTGEILKKSKLNGLFKANELLKENRDNLAEFLTSNPKGEQLVDYYLKLDDRLKKELQKLKDHNIRLKKKIRLINDVIAAQQKYANIGFEKEEVNLAEVTSYALTFYTTSLKRHNIKLEKNFEVDLTIEIQKTKLVHILVNLLKNAKESILETDPDEKCIAIRSYMEDDELHLAISDTGAGIEKKNRSKVFSHGFTTKREGHGFGLHSCANYMAEIGGKITAHSEGKGQGATFILIFPSSLILTDSQTISEATID